MEDAEFLIICQTKMEVQVLILTQSKLLETNDWLHLLQHCLPHSVVA